MVYTWQSGDRISPGLAPHRRDADRTAGFGAAIRLEHLVAGEGKGNRSMGETHVEVTIRNPAERDRCWRGRFLVDTGATDSQVPRRHLEAIGLSPVDSREYVLADGRAFSAEVTTADVEFMGRIVGSTVIFGEDGAEPLLGLTALESGGYAVDPVDGKLMPRRLRL